jgi:MGT family glycosyltransferase
MRCHDFAMGAGRPLAKSFLFTMFQGGGNLHLIVPIVRELTARRHHVRVLAGPSIWAPYPPPPTSLLERITGAGASAIPLPVPAQNPHQAAPRQPGLIFGWTPKTLNKARYLGIASWWAPAWATAVAAQLADDRPDALVADYLLLGALAAAERGEVPAGVLVHNATYPGPVPGAPPPSSGFPAPRTALDRLRDRAWAAAMRRTAARNVLPSLNRARASLRLTLLQAPFEQYERAGRVLILSSASFDFPAARLPANVRYVGTPFDPESPGPWRSPWPEHDRRPLVLVSLSTLKQGQGPVMQRVLRAVGNLPIRALVTLGPSLDPADFEAPPNAAMERFVPHAAVLPAAAALVTQCGLSTVSKALAHGVPMVCIPVTADQPDNAARVAAVGAGIRLGRSAGDGQIAKAIETILTDKRYKDGALYMAAQMSREHGAETAADELEVLASARSLAAS